METVELKPSLETSILMVLRNSTPIFARVYFKHDERAIDSALMALVHLYPELQDAWPTVGDFCQGVEKYTLMLGENFYSIYQITTGPQARISAPNLGDALTADLSLLVDASSETSSPSLSSQFSEEELRARSPPPVQLSPRRAPSPSRG